MTLTWHEMKQGFKGFAVWTASIGFLVAICVWIFPGMKGEMEGVSEMFASMGSFTAGLRHGQNQLRYPDWLLCGGVRQYSRHWRRVLCGDDCDQRAGKGRKRTTAEFLLTQPVSRTRIVNEKLAAVLVQIVGMNVVVFAISAGTIAAVGEDIPWKEFVLLHLAYLLMQVELAGICFGISAFLAPGRFGYWIGACGRDVLFEHHCQSLRTGGIFEIYHAVRLHGWSGYFRQRQTGHRHGAIGNDLWGDWYGGGLLAVHAKGYSLICCPYFAAGELTSPRGCGILK